MRLERQSLHTRPIRRMVSRVFLMLRAFHRRFRHVLCKRLIPLCLWVSHGSLYPRSWPSHARIQQRLWAHPLAPLIPYADLRHRALILHIRCDPAELFAQGSSYRTMQPDPCRRVSSAVQRVLRAAAYWSTPPTSSVVQRHFATVAIWYCWCGGRLTVRC